jgi:hypothetical protein
MALIEYLERGDWRGVLRRSFEGAITLLQTDRFRPTSSAIEDVKSWLTNGGVSRVQLQLDREMKGRRLEENHQREIRDFLEQLIQENQRARHRTALEIFRPSEREILCISSQVLAEFYSYVTNPSILANPLESQDAVTRINRSCNNRFK